MERIEDYSEFFQGENQDLGRQVYILSKVTSHILLNDLNNRKPNDKELFESMVLSASYYVNVFKKHYNQYYEYVMSMVVTELMLYGWRSAVIIDKISEDNMVKFIINRFDLYTKELDNLYRNKEEGKTYTLPLLIDKLYIDPLSISETIDYYKSFGNSDYLKLPIIFLAKLNSFIETTKNISNLISNIKNGNVKTS